MNNVSTIAFAVALLFVGIAQARPGGRGRPFGGRFEGSQGGRDEGGRGGRFRGVKPSVCEITVNDTIVVSKPCIPPPSQLSNNAYDAFDCVTRPERPRGRPGRRPFIDMEDDEQISSCIPRVCDPEIVEPGCDCDGEMDTFGDFRCQVSADDKKFVAACNVTDENDVTIKLADCLRKDESCSIDDAKIIYGTYKAYFCRRDRDVSLEEMDFNKESQDSSEHESADSSEDSSEESLDSSSEEGVTESSEGVTDETTTRTVIFDP